MDQYNAPPPVPERSSVREAASFNNVRQSTPQPSVVEGIAVDFGTVVAQTIQALIRQNNVETRTPLPTYAGLEQENPRIFVARLREYFANQHIDTNEERTALAARQLRGEAARWFAPYQSYPIAFEEFEERLLNRYDSASARATIKAKLYGDRQREGEPVSLFIIKKRALFARVDPNVGEDVMIAVILELLKSQTKAYLRGRIFNNIEEFSRIAEQIEADVGESTTAMLVRRPQPAPRFNNPAPTTTQQEPRQTYQSTQSRSEARQPTTQTSQSRTEPRQPPTPCRHCGKLAEGRAGPNEHEQCVLDEGTNHPPDQQPINTYPRQDNHLPIAGNVGPNLENNPFDDMDVEALVKDINQINSQENATLFAKTPQLNIRLNGSTIKALLDSGSVINTIRADLLPGITPEQETAQNFTLAAQDATIKSLGTRDLTFEIDGVSYTSTFHIIPTLQREALLGLPFFKEQSATIDFSRKCVHLGRVKRQTAYWDIPADAPTNETLPGELHIPESAPPELRQTLHEYRDLFSNPAHRPTTLSTTHKIVLTSDRNINIKPYPMSASKKQILYEQVDELLQRGIIEPSTSNYSSPPVIVERAGKKPRFCVDYRQLNSITKDEPSVLPNIHENLRDLGDARIFTLLDLRSGYWQVPMAEESKHLTAFSTPDGALYQFTVMPFGLKGAPATFQRLMTHEVLSGYLHKFVKVYLDDILIFSTTVEEHIHHLSLVFERLRLHNLRISAEKCLLLTSELDYLGHRISGEILTPQNKHLKEIERFETPRTKRQLQSFLGTLNWIRDYIPHVAKYTQPLTKLLKKDTKFRWTPEAQEAFEHLKQEAAKPLTLHRPDPARQLILQTDGSLEGLGAVLYQETESGSKQIISYASATLTPTERRYHVNEIETLAVIWAIKRYAHLLSDRHFLLRTDSRCLLWLNQNKEMRTKLARWSLLLQEFSFTIQHIPGKHNELPDFLSRHPRPTEDLERRELNEDRMLVPTINNINFITYDRLYQEVCQAQTDSRTVQRDIFKYENIVRYGAQDQHERNILDTYTVENNLLFKKVDGRKLLIVPRRLAKKVLQHFHDHPDKGHPGRDETIRQIQQIYHWRRLHRHVSDYVKRCLTCATMKTRQTQEAAPLRAHQPTGPFETVSIDVLGPYPETVRGNRFIIIATDIFTKWVEAKSTPRGTGREMVRFFKENIAARFGKPKIVISDNGSVFTGATFQNYLRRSRIEQQFTGVEHQRANPVERRIQEFKKVLRVITKGRRENRWDSYIAQALFILRNRTNTATNQTPSELVLGYRMPTPGEWDIPEYRRQRESFERPNHQEIQARQLNFQGNYANPDTPPPVVFQVGDRVLAKKLIGSGHAFSAAWTGPHEIVDVVSDVLYTINRDGGYVTYHVDKLRPAPPRQQPPEGSDDEGEDDEPPGNERDISDSSSDDNSETDEDDTSERDQSERPILAQQPIPATTSSDGTEPSGSGRPTTHSSALNTDHDNVERCPVGHLRSGRSPDRQPAEKQRLHGRDATESCQAGPSGSGRPVDRQPAEQSTTTRHDSIERCQVRQTESGRLNNGQPAEENTDQPRPPPRRRRRVRLVIRDAPPANQHLPFKTDSERPSSGTPSMPNQD